MLPGRRLQAPHLSLLPSRAWSTEGILDMVKAREATGLPIVTELMSEDRIAGV